MHGPRNRPLVELAVRPLRLTLQFASTVRKALFVAQTVLDEKRPPAGNSNLC